MLIGLCCLLYFCGMIFSAGFKQLTSDDIQSLARLSERIHHTNSNESFLNHSFVVLDGALSQAILSIENYSINPISFEQAVHTGISREESLIYQRYMHQHPLIKYFMTSSGLDSILTILKSTSADEFHKTDLYQQFYKPLGVEDQLVFLLTHSGVVYVVAYSKSSPFTEREELFMELLKPQLQIALRNWQRVRELERHLRTLGNKGVALGQDSGAGQVRKSLTPRQRAVAEQVAKGLENRQIAEVLHISPKTVGKHLENIFGVLGIHTRTALAAIWLESSE